MATTSEPPHVNAEKTHCIRGHEFTPENTQLYRGRRICVTCRRSRVRNTEASRASGARYRAEHRGRLQAEARARYDANGRVPRMRRDGAAFAPRPCDQCDSPIERPFHEKQRFCSEACSNTWRNARRTTEQTRRYRLSSKYGMTLEDFELMLAAQAGACAICGGAEPGAHGWAVDHCHETQQVRGILCTNCNTGIGQMKDDPARLRAAADYLEAACSRR